MVILFQEYPTGPGTGLSFEKHKKQFAVWHILFQYAEDMVMKPDNKFFNASHFLGLVDFIRN